jgi:hypothetical protein
MNKYIGSLAIFACIYFTSCKENTILSTSLIPKVDNINTFFTDTFSTIMNNVYFDSIITSNYTNGNKYYALGTIDGSAAVDNIFGKTVASMALQFRQPQVGISFPTDLIIDSMVLSMPYVNTYGDTMAGGNQTFTAYQLLSAPSKDSNYYVSKQLMYNTAMPLGSATYNFKKMDSVSLLEGKKEPQFRIKLDTNLARMLVNIRDTAEYASYSKFIDYFKGIYITPSDTNSGNMIAYFDYILSKINIYTRRIAVLDTVIYSFGFDQATCVHHNKIARNYAQNSPLINSFINSGNIKGDSLLFIQGDFGSTVQISFPNIANFENVIVNKAELEFNFIPSNNIVKDSMLRPVGLIRATGIDAVKGDYILSGDYALSSNNNIVKLINDGFRQYELINGNNVIKYKISITKTIQKAISEKNPNLKIRLLGFNGRLGGGRTMLAGSNRISQKAKINIIYTKIK